MIKEASIRNAQWRMVPDGADAAVKGVGGDGRTQWWGTISLGSQCESAGIRSAPMHRWHDMICLWDAVLRRKVSGLWQALVPGVGKRRLDDSVERVRQVFLERGLVSRFNHQEVIRISSELQEELDHWRKRTGINRSGVPGPEQTLQRLSDAMRDLPHPPSGAIRLLVLGLLVATAFVSFIDDPLPKGNWLFLGSIAAMTLAAAVVMILSWMRANARIEELADVAVGDIERRCAAEAARVVLNQLALAANACDQARERCKQALTPIRDRLETLAASSHAPGGETTKGVLVQHLPSIDQLNEYRRSWINPELKNPESVMRAKVLEQITQAARDAVWGRPETFVDQRIEAEVGTWLRGRGRLHGLLDFLRDKPLESGSPTEWLVTAALQHCERSAERFLLGGTFATQRAAAAGDPKQSYRLIVPPTLAEHCGKVKFPKFITASRDILVILRCVTLAKASADGGAR